MATSMSTACLALGLGKEVLGVDGLCSGCFNGFIF